MRSVDVMWLKGFTYRTHAFFTCTGVWLLPLLLLSTIQSLIYCCWYTTVRSIDENSLFVETMVWYIFFELLTKKRFFFLSILCWLSFSKAFFYDIFSFHAQSLNLHIYLVNLRRCGSNLNARLKESRTYKGFALTKENFSIQANIWRDLLLLWLLFLLSILYFEGKNRAILLFIWNILCSLFFANVKLKSMYLFK